MNEKAKERIFEYLKPKYQKSVIITTVGLVVHSIADGFALGSSTYASSSKGGTNLHYIIFLALLMHKLPAAIGFVTYLNVEGLQFREICKHLIVRIFLSKYRHSLVLLQFQPWSFTGVCSETH